MNSLYNANDLIGIHFIMILSLQENKQSSSAGNQGTFVNNEQTTSSSTTTSSDTTTTTTTSMYYNRCDFKWRAMHSGRAKQRYEHTHTLFQYCQWVTLLLSLHIMVFKKMLIFCH